MNEINEEIKLTINTMQCDIDDGVHGELQKHLNGLLEIKRNELQQRLVERSWLDHADGMGSVVSFDQAPYKSVKLDGQIADEVKPLTADELKASGWWCTDVSEECRLVFADKGIKMYSVTWSSKRGYEYCCLTGKRIARMAGSQTIKTMLKQIKRICHEFYWSKK